MVPKSKTWLFQLIFMILLYVSCNTNLSIGFGSDTISLNQSLSANQTLISKGRKFELGFFSPGNSTNYYIGIWYKNIPIPTVVWVANRDKPISHLSHYNSQLVLSEDGNLILFDGLQMPIWSTNSTIGTSNATDVVLHDTGNLVLRDGLGVIIWQSFDYPTDTFLPGGKVGLDKTTNRRQVYTSWRNSEDPSTGLFSLGIDASGRAELFLWRNGSQRYWRSGVWNGKTFDFLPGMTLNYLYNYSYVSNEDTNYYTYNIYNESIIARYVIGIIGQTEQWIWQDVHQWALYWAEPQQCDVYALCGAFGVCNLTNNPICSCLPGFVPRYPKDWNLKDSSGGCIRRNPLPLQCGKKDKVRFLQITNIRLPIHSQPLAVGRVEKCEFTCSVNCSCNAYAYNSSSASCFLWMGDLLNLEQLNSSSTAGGDLYLKLHAFEVPIPTNGNKKWLHVTLSVFILLPLVICGSLLCYLWRRKLNSKEAKETYQNLLILNLDISNKENNNSISIGNKMGEGERMVLDLPMFSFSSICVATDNFSTANKLGEGGFGPVYKGNLHNGQSVAIKRLSTRSGQGLEELRNETILIAKLQHRNLVRLLGFCIEQDEKILIYEFMSNKSLDFLLFDSSKRQLLDWRRRVQIIEGIAQGLLYLHQHSRLRIVHRDLKASNILLDDDMNPKISDFGMARIFGGNELQANTNRIVGTYGYMSPEYAMGGHFSIKSDVFAFGVLLLEIVSGKRNSSFHSSDCFSLLGYAWLLWKKGKVLELIDPILQIPSSSPMPLIYILVGLLCVQESPVDRPTMSDVIAMFSNEQTTLVSPKRPAFITGITQFHANSGTGKGEICSVNDLTTSVIEAR